ncbi:hypothetical protein SUGI_0601780 [Cryptomeria japonica]|nr:hypothetical protein SUGI_0601780 [Cryptomeria japonica]
MTGLAPGHIGPRSHGAPKGGLQHAVPLKEVTSTGLAPGHIGIRSHGAPKGGAYSTPFRLISIHEKRQSACGKAEIVTGAKERVTWRPFLTSVKWL